MTAAARPRFRHEAFLHRGDDEFLTGVLEHVREGLAQEETVVVAEPRPRLELLADVLAGDDDRVRLVDSAEVGGNPGRLMPRLFSLVAEHGGAGPDCASSARVLRADAARRSSSSAPCTRRWSTTPSAPGRRGG